jgi:hypothetical protein
MERLTPSEKKEILKKLRNKLNTDEVESIGYNRYRTSERYRVAVGDSFTRLTRDKIYDENGENIPTNPEYHNIFGFAKGVAVVCIRSNTQFIETESGPRFTQDRKDGLIDVNGKELLPCIYDSIHVHLDGFVEIKKDGICKSTRVDIIVSGEFDWDKASPWNN